VRWIIDPIDGTVNYLYRLPSYAVAIAAEVDGVLEVGVVHQPATGEVFAARRGHGATRNGEPVQVSQQTELSQALVATGFGYAAERRAAQGRVVAQVLPQVRDIRRLGASAPDLCNVACGRVDAYYERGLSPWDLAAASVIAEEAGAKVGGLHGAPAGGDLVIAAPPALFDALHDLLATLGADRD
jgi:myo-inositol-1(or 4)-monophosphatase